MDTTNSAKATPSQARLVFARARHHHVDPVAELPGILKKAFGVIRPEDLTRDQVDTAIAEIVSFASSPRHKVENQKASDAPRGGRYEDPPLAPWLDQDNKLPVAPGLLEAIERHKEMYQAGVLRPGVRLQFPKIGDSGPMRVVGS